MNNLTRTLVVITTLGMSPLAIAHAAPASASPPAASVKTPAKASKGEHKGMHARRDTKAGGIASKPATHARAEHKNQPQVGSAQKPSGNANGQVK